MGIFSRMSDIINSNINAILETAEDPEKIVRLIIQEMEDTLVEVRSAAARAIADKKGNQRKLAAIQDEVRDWEKKAELAVSKGRDDLAKAALREKNSAASIAAGLEDQMNQVNDGLEQLNGDILRLQEKLADLADTDGLPEDSKAYYQMWIKILEGHYMALFKSSEYTQTMGKIVFIQLAGRAPVKIEDRIYIIILI